MRSGRIRRTLKRHAKKKSKHIKNNKKIVNNIRRSLRKIKHSKSRRRKGTKKKKKTRRRTHKFQKALTQDYVNKFTSPHQHDSDCSVCSLSFLNVLPNSSLQDMINEIGCSGVGLEEVRQYFINSYGDYNFKFVESELFIYSSGMYKRDYMIRYLNSLEQIILPGHASLLALTRDTGRIGHFVVIGKAIDNQLVLFEPMFDPVNGSLGMYVGYEQIIMFLEKEEVLFASILISNLIDSQTDLSVSVPMETNELTYRCKLANFNPRKKIEEDTRERLKREQLEREILAEDDSW